MVVILLVKVCRFELGFFLAGILEVVIFFYS